MIRVYATILFLLFPRMELMAGFNKIRIPQAFSGGKDVTAEILACEDLSILPNLEAIALRKIGLLRIKETGIEFSNPPEIEQRYSFPSLPCTRLYMLKHLDSSDPYKYLLFNSCDSSMYRFGGDIENFAIVTSEYFDEKLDENRLIDLLDFYLNTLSPNVPYFILQSKDDLEFYDKLLHPDDHLLPGDTVSLKFNYLQEKEKALRKAKERFVPVEINSFLEIFSVTFCTYNWNEFEFWHFRVSNQGIIELFERKTLLEMPSFSPFGKNN